MDEPTIHSEPGDDPDLVEHLERLAAGGSVPDEARARIEADPALAARLAAIQADNDLLGELAAVARRPNLGAGSALPRDPVPGYRVTGELGRGGQGVVYRAEQIATRRAVALKLLARGVFAGARARRRLTREIEVLAALRHPAVVTVHDGGVTDDGRPWLAMELVEGRRFDEAAAAIRTETLGHPRSRDRRIARLVRDVAAGIEAAHARGVMHRDLKPGNVLVDANGDPHVLDFGLARETAGGETSISEGSGFMGTLLYAAPEQIAGDPSAIDVRADVFALGMLLHESLAGRRPWPDPANLEDAVARVRQPAEPLRRAAPGVDPDLETIAMRCLAADADRRYPSAGHVREELDRFLDRRPITARRDSSAYRLRMLVRRRPVEVGAAASIAALVLAFAVTAGWQASRLAERSRRYREAASTIVAAIAEVKRDEETGLPDVADLLEQIAGVIETRLPADPAVGIRARRELGAALLLERRLDTAQRLLDDAIAMDAENPRAIDGRERAELLHALGQVLYARGDYERATTRYTEALAWRTRSSEGPEDDVLTARTMAHLAACNRVRRNWGEAGRLYREALERTEAVRGPDDLDVLKRRNSYAVFLVDRGRFAAGSRQFETLHESFRRTGREATTGGATALLNLGRCLVALGRMDEAEPLILASLRHRRDLDPGDDRRIGQAEAVLGRLWLDRGEPADAIATLDRAVTRLEAAGPAARALLATARTDRALAHLAGGHRDAARSDVDAALAFRGIDAAADPAELRLDALEGGATRRAASATRTVLAHAAVLAADGEAETAAAWLTAALSALENPVDGHEPDSASRAVELATAIAPGLSAQARASAEAVIAHASTDLDAGRG